MKKEDKSTSVDFHAIRPFGPTILQGKLPDNLIKILAFIFSMLDYF